MTKREFSEAEQAVIARSIGAPPGKAKLRRAMGSAKWYERLLGYTTLRERMTDSPPLVERWHVPVRLTRTMRALFERFESWRLSRYLAG